MHPLNVMLVMRNKKKMITCLVNTGSNNFAAFSADALKQAISLSRPPPARSICGIGGSLYLIVIIDLGLQEFMLG